LSGRTRRLSACRALLARPFVDFLHEQACLTAVAETGVSAEAGAVAALGITFSVLQTSSCSCIQSGPTPRLTTIVLQPTSQSICDRRCACSYRTLTLASRCPGPACPPGVALRLAPARTLSNCIAHFDFERSLDHLLAQHYLCPTVQQRRLCKLYPRVQASTDHTEAANTACCRER
jgi:hypothetical protein